MIEVLIILYTLASFVAYFYASFVGIYDVLDNGFKVKHLLIVVFFFPVVTFLIVMYGAMYIVIWLYEHINLGKFLNKRIF